MMKTVLHRADSRGHADHGWLDTHHTFSFASYHHPERMRFGVLRVLNDDRVAPGRGFGTHPHDNMEIISIPLEGDLEHKDSMGNTKVIREGDLQVMSAGTGIFHSEYNRNPDREVKFLQIWIFPDKKDVEPRYDQISLRDVERKNDFYQVVSPERGDQGAWIHQKAWFHMGNFDPETEAVYRMKHEGNGTYVFVLEGELEAAGILLERRDGLGLWEVSEIPFRFMSQTSLLIMEVPMTM